MTFLNRLSLWKKLTVLAVGLLLPAVLFGYLYLRSAAAAVGEAEREVQGTEYLSSLADVLEVIAKHRGQSGAFLLGEKSFRDATLATEAAAEVSIAKLDAIDAGHAEKLQVKGKWAPIKTHWLALKARTLGLPAAESYNQHSAVMREITDLADTVSDTSGLALDPEKTTYYLQLAAFPEFFDSLSDVLALRGKTTAVSARGSVTPADLTDIHALRDALTKDIGRMKRVLERSWEASPAARAATSQPFQNLSDAANVFLDLVFKRILLPDSGSRVTAAETFQAGDRIANVLMAVSAAAKVELVTELQQRSGAERRQRNLSVALTFLLAGAALGLCWLITRSMTRPLARAIAIFESISAGKYDNAIEQTSADEVGQVLRSLDVMQGKLRAQIESERMTAAANGRIKCGLDKASAAIMLADENLDIIYVNESAQTLFRANQGDFRRDIPSLDAERIRGSNFDIFRNPGLQSGQLASLRTSHTSDAIIGGRSMRLAASPVISEAGEHIGTIVEWWDRTEEVRAEEEVSVVVKGALDGNLTNRVRTGSKSGFYDVLARGLNQLLDNVSQIVEQVKTASQEVHRGAEEITAGNINLSQRTEEQSASLEETASSMEEMTSTVRQNADNASQASQLAIAAREHAEKGGAVVGNAVRAMTGINESSKRIAAIIGVIDEIAFQTNLLALNAAVEAARAGEQGRGFAVVATEVRSLAGRSATAAKEIKELIQDSVQKVESGSALVTQSGQTLEIIVSSVKKVSDIIGEIAAASREQSSGIEQVNKAVMQMDEMTQQNAALVEQAAAASKSMSEQAGSLSQAMNRYRVGTDAASMPGDPAPSAALAKQTRAAVKPGTRSPERRGAGRPWSKKATVANRTSMESRPAAPAATTADSHDTDWKEF